MKNNFGYNERDDKVRCKDCNRPIKKKLVESTGGKVDKCNDCHNISIGKTFYNKHKWNPKTGQHEFVKKIDYIKRREHNRRIHGWYDLSRNRDKKFKEAS